MKNYHNVYEEFQQYRRNRIYNHIIFFSKYVSLLGALVVFGITYSILGHLTFGIVFILLSYFSLFAISGFIIKNNIVNNFEDFAGPLIYIGTSYLLCAFDHEINGDNNDKPYFAPRGTTQLTAILSWVFVQDCKSEVICKLIQAVIYILFRIKIQNKHVAIHEIVDMNMDMAYYIFLSYLLNTLNYKYFCSFLEKINEAILQFSEGLDKLNESILLLDIEENIHFSINTMSKSFMGNFAPSDKIIPIKELLQNFILMEKRSETNKREEIIDYKVDSTLYDNIRSILTIKSKMDNNLINYVLPKKDDSFIADGMVYSIYSATGKKELYEVRMVKYHLNTISFNKCKLLILFKLLDNSEYEKKANINLNLLKLQIDEIKCSICLLKENLQLVSNKNKKNKNKNNFSEHLNTKDTKNFNFENLLDENNLLKLSDILSFLLQKTLFYIKLVQINNLNQSFLSSKSEEDSPIYNLEFIVNKSFKCFEYFKRRLISEYPLKQTFIKIDLKLFRLLIKFIIFYLESYSDITNIQIKFIKEKNSHFIEMEFVAFNCDENVFESNSLKKTEIQESLFFMLSLLSTSKKLLITESSKQEFQTLSINLKIENIRNDDIYDKYFSFVLFDKVAKESEKLLEFIDNNEKSYYEIFEKLDSQIDINQSFYSKDIIDENNSILTKKIKIACGNEQKFIKPYLKKSNKSINNFKHLTDCSCFKVLIVDDDSMCINYVKNVVKTVTNKIQVATDGLKAFERVQELAKRNTECADCEDNKLMILMDIHMPIMNGIESAKLISTFLDANKDKIQYKILFISGNVDSQYLNLIKSMSHCIGHCSKPIKKLDLLNLLGKYL